jgi:hypothetical protein
MPEGATSASEIPSQEVYIGVGPTTCQISCAHFSNNWNAACRRARGTPLTEFAKLHCKVGAVFAHSERSALIFVALIRIRNQGGKNGKIKKIHVLI